MSLYISNRQVTRDHPAAAPVPMLLGAPHLQMQQRFFPEGFEFANLVQDTYELCNSSEAEESYFLLPSGCMTLIFLFSGGDDWALLCGALTTMRRLRLAPGATAYCVRLRSGCGEWLTGSNVSLLTDNAVPLEQYLPGTAQLLQELKGGESFHERNVMFFRLLGRQGGRTYQSMALLRRCLDLIAENRGQIHVSELAATVGCSERYLNRIFRERVGISTKTHCEIVQLQNSLYSILTTQPKSLLHIAVACGYFDQAHMNRHYRKFLRCTANDMRCADERSIYAEEISAAL